MKNKYIEAKILMEYVKDRLEDAEFYSQTRKGTSDEVFFNHMYGMVKDALTRQRTELLDAFEEIIKDTGPALVLPIKDIPFREDYINKWNLLNKVATLRKKYEKN